MGAETIRETLSEAITNCPDCEIGVCLDGTGHPCMTCAGTRPGYVYVFGPNTRWANSEVDWELEAIWAGANLMRTWFDRVHNCWWADVRMVEAHKPSSVVQADNPTEARLKALEMAVKKIPGVSI